MASESSRFHCAQDFPSPFFGWNFTGSGIPFTSPPERIEFALLPCGAYRKPRKGVNFGRGEQSEFISTLARKRGLSPPVS
jgi:hypothetical protein